MKRYDFTVPENAQGTRLFPCACRMLPQVPAYALRRAFQKRDVKVDGHRVDLSAMAGPGTQVCIYTDEARVKTVPVVYQDENVLVAVKPAGVSCEPDRQGRQDVSPTPVRTARPRNCRAATLSPPG